MKIITYNVNGLRARLSLSRTLRSFLDSLDADIICLQETKISRQELTADVAVADGYESFLSCTRTVKKGRVGYSGVATFCRIKQGNGTDVALPVTAEEGVTGLLSTGCSLSVEDFTKQELLQLDSEGRCIITDHGHFVLFNIYGPNAGGGDEERQNFKLNFYKALQCRLESFLDKGRRVIVAGDFNIAPFPIDSCDPGPNFEKNLSRKWLRSMLEEEGGAFSDAFRNFHPDTGESYTCWSQASGAEEFNYGTRIDLVLVAGPCLSVCCSNESKCGFAHCGLKGCSILHSFRRHKADSLPRWTGGRSLKLDGSDHAPVMVQLQDLPNLPVHDVPAIAARFMPELRGRQQNILSIFRDRAENSNATENSSVSTILTKTKKLRKDNSRKLSQSSLHSFCVAVTHQECTPADSATAARIVKKDDDVDDDDDMGIKDDNEGISATAAAAAAYATSEWSRLKQLMSQKLPVCKGHGEPCVIRTVKKAGVNVGRGFYVCARGKGPSTNLEARCDHFQWATNTKASKQKKK